MFGAIHATSLFGGVGSNPPVATSKVFGGLPIQCLGNVECSQHFVCASFSTPRSLGFALSDSRQSSHPGIFALFFPSTNMPAQLLVPLIGLAKPCIHRRVFPRKLDLSYKTGLDLLDFLGYVKLELDKTKYHAHLVIL